LSTKKKIILHGFLADLYPHAIEVEATTISEAIRSLSQIPELAPVDGQPIPVTIRDVNSEIALFSVTTMTDIHVYPRTGGAGGDNGLTQILIGIALIAVAVFAPTLFPALGGLITATSVATAGAMMVLGGVMQMLTPMPEAASGSTDERSNYLGANQNTVKIGTNIPLAYGNVKMSGHYLSFDVDSKDDAGISSLVNEAGVSLLDGVETDEVTFGDVFYFEYDRTPVQKALVNPIYAGSVASPTNVPTSAWIA
jgi:predicted phage tail protein